MRAVQAHAGGVRVVDSDVPDGDGELIRVHAVSICASDTNYIRRGSSQILGHEISGFTESGDAVVVEGIFGCEACEWCAQGRFNLCVYAGRDILGMTVPGGMSEFFRVPRTSLIPIPAGLSVDDASLVEPGAVAWHAARSAGAAPGVRVAVVGAGAIGILAVLAARQMGAAEVSLEARHPYQIELGERIGATAISGQYDAIVEASGTQSGLARGFELARARGVLSSVSVYPSDIDWPYRAAFLKEVHMVPSLGYDRHDHGVSELTHVADMLASAPHVAEELITHRFDLEDAPEAFRVAQDREARPFRVVVHP